MGLRFKVRRDAFFGPKRVQFTHRVMRDELKVVIVQYYLRVSMFLPIEHPYVVTSNLSNDILRESESHSYAAEWGAVHVDLTLLYRQQRS